jgi:uncharacterized damage-inducible protein DinB
VPTTPTQKDIFLETFSREHTITMKVLHALPSGQGEFRPHPRSQSARDLAWTFVMEQGLITAALTDTLKITGQMPKAPDDINAIIAQFGTDFDALVALFKSTPDDRYLGGTVAFPSGPGQMMDFPVADFCWFMLFDQIHHRGQLSVYVRMAGGKVPSIYGPSADEPWM